MGLECTNCSREVEPNEAKFFGAPGNGQQAPNAAVFVCSDCYALAELFDQRAMQQLKSLMMLSRECLRLALMEKRLKLGPLPPQRDLTKREVFESLLHMLEKRDEVREEVKKQNEP